MSSKEHIWVAKVPDVVWRCTECGLTVTSGAFWVDGKEVSGKPEHRLGKVTLFGRRSEWSANCNETVVQRVLES